MLATAVPAVQGLQNMVASPTGVKDFYARDPFTLAGSVIRPA
jgi:hypothetical protein